MKKVRVQPGFTLAELLIALAILGVIATFTIPKILDSGASGQKNAMAKEVASMIAGAFQSYKLQNAVSGSTSVDDLTPFMNYVAVDTTSTVDIYTNTCVYGAGPCSALDCLRLHNGGILSYGGVTTFNTTDVTSAIVFAFDPDGTALGAGNTESHSVLFLQYANGRLVSAANSLANTEAGNLPYNPGVACDPPWFSWSN